MSQNTEQGFFKIGQYGPAVSVMLRLGVALLFGFAAIATLLSSARQDVVAIASVFDDAEYGYFASLHHQRAENREQARLDLASLLKGVTETDKRQYASFEQTNASALESDTKLENKPLTSSYRDVLHLVTDGNTETTTPVFDETLLPAQCQADFGYLTKSCSRLWKSATQLDAASLAQCQAYALRQAVSCEVSYCEERLKSRKRSFFIWGLVLAFIGGAVGAVSPQFGILIAAIGGFSMGLSIAPIFDIFNFINCR